jgi:neutral ceramidase
LPTEPTTVAGARLARVVSRGLGDPGLFVVVCGYTDAYCGYLTTPEEYALQHYEGGATLYGKHALGAFCTVFDGLAHAIHEGSPVDRGPAPPSVAPESCVPAFDPRELLTV